MNFYAALSTQYFVMADICRYCNAELFEGQRFCRACGKTTDTEAEENTPTRRMPPPPDLWGARGAANTGPTMAAETRPVYAPPSAYPQTPAFYQPPPMPVPQGAMTPYLPPRSNSTSWMLIVVVIILTVLGGAIIGGRAIVRKVKERVAEKMGPGKKTSPTRPSETRTFTLSANATVSIKTFSGDISVESSDQPEAEVKIIRSGGADNNQSSIVTNNDNGNLSLEVLPGSGNSDIRFEVRLPRKVNVGKLGLNSLSGSVNVSGINGQITINTASGDITMSRINGPIAINTASGGITLSDTQGLTTIHTASGDIRLNDVSGVERVDTASGDINGSFRGESLDHAVSLKSVSGSIDLNIEPGFNATLDASSKTGSIRIDDGINIPVQKSSPIGQRASGPIGKGGQTFSISTTSGDIELNR